LIVGVREVGVFTAVGTTATAINLGVVAVAVPLGLSPLVANVVGFVISFVWSFFGHARWTFPAEGRDVGIALQRFAVVSVLGFGLTEAAYAGALQWTSVDYRLLLFLIIVALAGGKLLASKHWAFARA
jgi:putative flippase GtrA